MTLPEVFAISTDYTLNDITKITVINDHAINIYCDGQLFMVCDSEGEELLLQEYRQATIEAAYLDIPKIYHDFFEFNEYADYTWQSIYDIYDIVNEVEENDKKYYICLV